MYKTPLGLTIWCIVALLGFVHTSRSIVQLWIADTNRLANYDVIAARRYHCESVKAHRYERHQFGTNQLRNGDRIVSCGLEGTVHLGLASCNTWLLVTSLHMNGNLYIPG